MGSKAHLLSRTKAFEIIFCLINYQVTSNFRTIIMIEWNWVHLTLPSLEISTTLNHSEKHHHLELLRNSESLALEQVTIKIIQEERRFTLVGTQTQFPPPGKRVWHHEAFTKSTRRIKRSYLLKWRKRAHLNKMTLSRSINLLPKWHQLLEKTSNSANQRLTNI